MKKQFDYLKEEGYKVVNNRDELVLKIKNMMKTKDNSKIKSALFKKLRK